VGGRGCLIDDGLSVIDAATNKAIDTLPLLSQPLGVAVSPDGSKVYVSAFSCLGDCLYSVSAFSCLGDCLFSTGVSVIDAATNKVITTIAPVGHNPNGVAVTPDGSKVYVTAPNTVSVITTATNRETATILVGHNPKGVAVTPDGRKVYVANELSNNVSVIDAATNKLTATIPVGERPIAFGLFIGPAAAHMSPFAGTPGFSNCEGQSIAALDRQFGGRNAAAAALGFSDVPALENAVLAFCR
jgi:YVTN family beta-propeller protein